MTLFPTCGNASCMSLPRWGSSYCSERCRREAEPRDAQRLLGSLRAGCPIDDPGAACQQDCPGHCREGAFELNVGDDLEPPGPGECRYCGMAVQHKLQCPGWPGQRVEPGHTEEHGFTPGELKTGGPARPAPWPLGDDDV